jgi:putative ABC transport system permease protein
MKLKDIGIISIEGMKERKFRVALNIVGIMIGVSALVALVSITEGMNYSITQELQTLGPTTITVVPFSGFMGPGARARQGSTAVPETSDLTLRDVDQLQKLPDVAVATPIISHSVQIKISGYTGSVTMLGIIPDEYTQIIQTFELDEGRFLKNNDRVLAVLGANVAHPPDLEEPIASLGSRVIVELTLSGEKKTLTLRVAGILSEVGGTFGSSDNQIYVILRTAQNFLDTGNEVDQILVSAEDIELVDSVRASIREELGEGITAVSSDFVLDMIGSITGTIGAVLGGVAAISLVVAGIAIINTMTISVMERTREIGIMKALGAKSKDVLLMFLMESSLTGLMGGVIGVVLGMLLSQAVGAIISFSFAFSLTSVTSIEVVMLGVGFALGAGTLSGLYPSQKASKLHPVEALRYE